MAVGGNFAASRAALERIGGFDTAIAFYGEDTNIARRLSAQGKVAFLRGLTMPTSSRRLHAEGMLATAWRYGTNFLSEVVLKRPVTQAYRDIR
jgi:GT2 family glycosyltransferase